MEDEIQRIGIYIDVSNIEGTIVDSNFRYLALDYSELIRQISEGYEIAILKAYDGDLGANTYYREIHKALEAAGVEVRLFKTQTVRLEGGKTETRQKEVDTAITTDVSWDLATRAVDVAAIISGDRDMLPALHRAAEEGYEVRMYAPEDSISGDNKNVNDHVYIIEDLDVFVLATDVGDRARNVASFPVRQGGGSDE